MYSEYVWENCGEKVVSKMLKDRGEKFEASGQQK